ncbi:MAG TPA: hypothetical protein DHN33_07520 [Eubacteriaceae bacterium]|nr:hypothetical protein [Eubacteriaceae bacterium]
MNIFVHEMKSNLRSLLIWSAVIIVIIIMMMTEFSAYYNNPEMEEVLDMVPQAILEALSMEGTNITTVSGFVSMASIYFYIMLSIYSVLLGSSILAKEERDKTAEFFLTMPVSREKIIVVKWSAAVILSFIVNLVTTATVWITTMQYEKMDDFAEFLFFMMAAIFILQLIFLSIGMFLSALVKRYKKSGIFAISLLMVLYFISVLMTFSEKLDFFKYITPFKYFEAAKILENMSLDGVNLLLSGLVIVFCMAGTLIVYPKRDLNI